MKTVIHNVTIAAEAHESRATVDIVINDDGRIGAIDAPARHRNPDARHLDGSGLHAFPGLVDCHVHLCFAPDAHPERELLSLSDPQLLERADSHARQAMSRGVTTLRDLGSRGDTVRTLKRDIAAGIRQGPRIICSGPALTIPGGHCYYVGQAVAAEQPATAASLVDEHAAEGDEWIKLIVTGGALTSGSSPEHLQFPASAVDAVISRARHHKVPVAAHVLNAAGAAIAVREGARTIEHGVGLSSNELRAMRDRDQYLVATLTPATRVLASGGGDPEHVAKLRMVRERSWHTVREAAVTGVGILAGTDAGCPLVEHGLVVEELKLLEQAGLSRAQALLAATETAADALALDIGRLRRGSAGDVLLLAGDPHDDLGHLESPIEVLVGGRPAAGRPS